MLEHFIGGVLQGAAKESQEKIKRDYLKSQKTLMDLQVKAQKAALDKAEAKDALIKTLGAAGQPIQEGVGVEGGLGMDVSYGGQPEPKSYVDAGGESLSGRIVDYSKGGFGMGAGEQMPTDIQTQDQYLADQQARTVGGQRDRLLSQYKGLSLPEIITLNDGDISKAMDVMESIRKGELSNQMMQFMNQEQGMNLGGDPSSLVGKQPPDPRTANLGGIIDSKGFPTIGGLGADQFDTVKGTGAVQPLETGEPNNAQPDVNNFINDFQNHEVGVYIPSPNFDKKFNIKRTIDSNGKIAFTYGNNELRETEVESPYGQGAKYSVFTDETTGQEAGRMMTSPPMNQQPVDDNGLYERNNSNRFEPKNYRI